MKNNFGKTFETGILPDQKNFIHLFRPHIPEKALEYISEVLKSRWIGQGPKVEIFENLISARFCSNLPGIAVGSGTDALHLAYLLAGIQADDEVIVPLFTCTATNIPLLYIGAKPIFVDIDRKTLNIDPNKIEAKINHKTKAIVVVHYGGLPCDMTAIKKLSLKYNLPIIEDAAHALGAKYFNQSVGAISDFTIFSFQAIKHLTTGDGGYLSIKNSALLEKAKRLRWFGIDRSAKQMGVWENDIHEIGYKYQMTDLAAAIGIAGIEEFENTLAKRKNLFTRYINNLNSNTNFEILNLSYDTQIEHACWLFTVFFENKNEIQVKLHKNGVESGQVHYRNDRYSIFENSRVHPYPAMNAIENNYLVLPLHTQMSLADVDKICEIITS